LTSIVFTLENGIGEIFGRKTLSFKVCSCPKRDKEKDEDGVAKVFPKKRKSEYVAPSTSKKVAMTVALPVPVVKQESDSTISVVTSSEVVLTPPDVHSLNSGLQEVKRERSCVVPSFAMPTPEMRQMVLTTAFNAVAGELARTGDTATLQPYLNDLQNKIDDN